MEKEKIDVVTLEKSVTKFAHYLDWVDEIQGLGHYRMDNDDIREILQEYGHLIKQQTLRELIENINRLKKDIIKTVKTEQDILLNIDYGYNQALEDLKVKIYGK